MSQATQAQACRTFPQVGEVFELTASVEITGLGLIADFGQFGSDPSSKWHTNAATIPAGTTCRFWLQPGHACKAWYRIPEGVWMKVFDETFGSNSQNPVGIYDPSWHQGGVDFYPMVDQKGRRRFIWSHDRDDNWLYLFKLGHHK